MLIATEALRASLEGIQGRLDYIRANGEDNYEDIDWNLSVLAHTRQILEDNEDELRDIEEHIHEIEEGYECLHELLAMDRNVLVMMCHQYAYAEEIVQGVILNQQEIDGHIRSLAQNWDFERIAKIDLAILRLAIFEMLRRQDVPPVVSINEAIDLSKQFSNADSKRFINGILDRLKSQLGRDARKAG